MRKLYLILFLFSSISIGLFGKDTTVEKEKFNIKKMIFHHIKDSHEFHVIANFSLPLPVILHTKDGFVAFMSSEFHHNDDGTVVVSKKGHDFVKFYEKIYYSNNNGTISLDAKGHPTNKLPLDFSITKNVFSLFLSIALLLFIFLKTAKSYKKNKSPKGIAKFTEPLILFIRNEIAIPTIGKKKYKRYLPYLLTIFFFIWINNLIGLIPFFPFNANLSGNIAFTLTLASITFFITQFSGNKNYWGHIFWMPGVPIAMKFFLAIIEFIGVFIKPIALFVRLFANITAGHIVVLALIGLIFLFQDGYGDIAGILVSPVSVLFVVFISLIEILVVAVQAYIFTMLSALYFGMATEEKHN